jgi:hypothetical protein
MDMNIPYSARALHHARPVSLVISNYSSDIYVNVNLKLLVELVLTLFYIHY